MKLPCELVRDLLPLYHDGVCSGTTNTLVEAHLESCQDCQRFLKNIDSEIEVPEMEMKQTNGLVAIQKNWHRSLLRSFAKGLLIATLVCSILFGGFVALTQINFPISTEGWEVAEIYRLKNGNIIYRMEGMEETPTYWNFYFLNTEDGFYRYPRRPIVDTVALQCELQDIPAPTAAPYLEIDEGENLAHAARYGGPDTHAWYWGKPGQAVLIYEEGMELPPAPPELEERYG